MIHPIPPGLVAVPFLLERNLEPIMQSKLIAASATVAFLAFTPAKAKLKLLHILRRALDGLERRWLEALASSQPSPTNWFDGLQQELTSAATNTIDTKPTEYKGPTVYQAEHELPLPYPPISDDTEGIAGLEGVAQFVKPGMVLLNLGGGAFDGPGDWLAQKTNAKVLTADPWRRSAEHNEAVQRTVEAAGGADVVASVSVLNVVADAHNRLAHIKLVRRALKPGGVACFKIWAGCWPERGTGASADDWERGSHQQHKWAGAFEPELAAVFGAANVLVDNNHNMCVAVRA